MNRRGLLRGLLGLPLVAVIAAQARAEPEMVGEGVWGYPTGFGVGKSTKGEIALERTIKKLTETHEKGWISHSESLRMLGYEYGEIVDLMNPENLYPSQAQPERSP